MDLLPSPPGLSHTRKAVPVGGLATGRSWPALETGFASELVLCTAGALQDRPCACGVCAAENKQVLDRALAAKAKAERTAVEAVAQADALRAAAAEAFAAEAAQTPVKRPNPEDWTPRTSKQRERLARLATERKLADAAATVDRLANGLQQSEANLKSEATERQAAEAAVIEMEGALVAVTAAQSDRREQAQAVSQTMSQMKSHLRMRLDEREQARHGVSMYRKEQVGQVISPRSVALEQERDAAVAAQAAKIAEQGELLSELTDANEHLRQGLEAAHTLIHKQRGGGGR